MQVRKSQGKKAIASYAANLKKMLVKGLEKGPENAINGCKFTMEQMENHPVHRTSLM